MPLLLVLDLEICFGAFGAGVRSGAGTPGGHLPAIVLSNGLWLAGACSGAGSSGGCLRLLATSVNLRCLLLGAADCYLILLSCFLRDVVGALLLQLSLAAVAARWCCSLSSMSVSALELGLLVGMRVRLYLSC